MRTAPVRVEKRMMDELAVLRKRYDTTRCGERVEERQKERRRPRGHHGFM